MLYRSVMLLGLLAAGHHRNAQLDQARTALGTLIAQLDFDSGR